MIFYPLVKWIFWIIQGRNLSLNGNSTNNVKESTLTNFLINTLHNGGIEKLIKLHSYQEVNFYREIGTSSYIADICISINNLTEFDNESTKLIAIEVKISDWENGLYQAWRYNNFAEKSFLAIYKPFAEKVDIREFINHNIGLIVFDKDNIEVLYNPKSNRFEDQTYEADIRRKVWGNLSKIQSIFPTH